MGPEAAVPALAAALGLIVGSFLNVCIIRLPNNESLVRPRSKCPRCGSPIAWYDNVPILSWLFLLGRCRQCRAPISAQYPLVEAAVGVLWAASFWYYGLTLTALAGSVFGTILLGIAATDAKHYLIPDEYSVGGLALGLAFSLRNGFPGVTDAVLGTVVGFGLLYLVAWAGERVFGEEAMGGGDIKMMAMVGSFVGWKGVLLTVFGGALLGSIVFVPLSFGRRRLVPFGVFLAMAAAIVFVVGERIARWYFDFLRAA